MATLAPPLPPPAIPPAPDEAVPTRARPVLAILLVLAVALAFADASVVALALPDLYAAFDTSIVGVSWVLTTYALVVAIVAVPVTLLHRRLRPLGLTVAGLAVFAAASVAAGVANSLPWLLTARAVQGVGATFLLAGSLPVLGALLGSRARARTWWAAAAAVGAVTGPALGGLLTQIFDWRSIFLTQAPVAVLALVVVAAGSARAARADRDAPRGGFARTLVPNIGFVLVFAALVAALFLGVLMAIEVWGYSPLQGAILVSTLPIGMLAVRPLAGAPGLARGVGGSLVLAAGLAGLAFLPGASPWPAAGAFFLCGAGFGLVSSVLGPEAVPAGGAEVRDSSASIGFRHAGLVLGLVLIAPVLTAGLDQGTQNATLGATRSMLEAKLPLSDKIPVTWDLRNAIVKAPRGQVPDLVGVFNAHGAAKNPALAAARDDLMNTISDTITRAFRPAFGVAAALAAVSAVPAAAVARRRRREAPARRRRRTALAMLGVLGVGAVGLFGVEQAAGAATVGTFKQVNACTASPDTYDGGGLDGWAQRVALSALNGAACELHTSRERLVLSLDPNSGYSNVTWDKATAKKAIQSGLKRAIKDGEDRGGLPGWAGSVLDFATDHAPIDWILNLFPYFK